MKKKIQYFLFILPLILMSACTLSMEEWIVTEEKKGVDEPYTEVTPFGDFTYQYRKNVTPLNGKPQEYIAMMNDSVIWFMDNLPSKWIPKEGNYIAANCSRIMPTGVNAKVRSVTREAGMIRVEHEQATQEEVFEFMSVSIDFDYDTPNVNDMDSVEASTRGMILREDSIVIDMSLFDRMENPHTRTPAEESKDTTITWKYSKDWKYFGVEVNYSNTQHRKFHLFDNGLGRKEEWTDTYEIVTWDITTKGGVSGDKGYENFETPGDFEDHFKEVQKHLKDAEALGFKPRETLKMKTKGLCIPVPGTAFSVIIDFDASFNWELRGFVHGKINYLSPVVRRGYIIENKVETKVEKQWPANKEELKDIPNNNGFWNNPNGTTFVLSDVYFGGSFDVNGRVRGGVGFILGKSYAGAGLVIGLEGKVGFKGECSMNYVGTGVDEYTIIDKENLWLEPYIQLNAYIEGAAVVAGEKIDLGGTSFTLLGTDWKTNINPVVNSKRCSKSYTGIYKTNDKGERVFGSEINASIEYKKLETFLLFPKVDGEADSKKKKPCIRIYPNDLDSKQYVTIEHNSSDPIKAGKTYEFVANTLELGLPDVEDYHIVPCIMEKAGKIVTEFRNNVMVLSKAEPRIEKTQIYQWYGEPLSEETFEYYKEKNPMLKFFKHTDFVEYAFSTVVRVKNGSLVTKWGLNFQVYDEGKKNRVFLNKNVDVIIGRGETKAGKYSVIGSFIMNKVPKNSGEWPTIVATPYVEWVEGKETIRRNGDISKPLPLNYPYRREGGAYTVGTTEYIAID